MKKLSISTATACLMLLGLASAHAAGMGQDDMKKPAMDAKSDAMLHKAMRKQGNKDDMMQKSGSMQKAMQGSMQKDMHGTMNKDAMQK